MHSAPADDARALGTAEQRRARLTYGRGPRRHVVAPDNMPSGGSRRAWPDRSAAVQPHSPRLSPWRGRQCAARAPRRSAQPRHCAAPRGQSRLESGATTGGKLVLILLEVTRKNLYQGVARSGPRTPGGESGNKRPSRLAHAIVAHRAPERAQNLRQGMGDDIHLSEFVKCALCAFRG